MMKATIEKSLFKLRQRGSECTGEGTFIIIIIVIIIIIISIIIISSSSSSSGSSSSSSSSSSSISIILIIIIVGLHVQSRMMKATIEKSLFKLRQRGSECTGQGYGVESLNCYRKSLKDE